MYKPKKHVRLDSLISLPRLADLKNLLVEARKSKGCTVELPWTSKRTKMPYSLTVRVEISGGEPIWTLYEGEGSTSRVMWSSPFEDMDLLYDVMCLSLPADVNTDLRGEPDEFASSSAKAPREIDTSFTMPPRPDAVDEPFFLKEDDFPKPRPVRVEPVAPPPEPAVAAAPAAPAPAPDLQPAQPPYPYPPGYAPPPGYAAPPGYAPPPGYAYPPGYAQPQYPYPPGYGYPPGYPPGYAQPQVYIDPRTNQAYTAYPQYPYPQQPAQPVATTVPVQPGVPYSPAEDPPPPPTRVDGDLFNKRPNVLLGHFLVEAGLIPEPTLNSALRLQEMVKSGSLTTTQAAEAVRRAHNRGGALDPNLFSATPPGGPPDPRIVAPPLGQILVEAGLINPNVLKAALDLQEVVRTGAMTKEDAVSSFITEHFGKAGKHGTGEPPEAQKAIDLCKKAGLLQEQDFQAAAAVKKKHGGEVAKILAAAGKLDANTFTAAVTCNELIEKGRLKMEQAIIALHYCQRSRVSFEDAVDEMGWEKP